MLSQGMIKHEFVVQTLEWGLSRIRELQLAQLASRRHDIESRHFNFARLVEGVEHNSAGIVGSNGHYRLAMPVDKQLRFADMKRFSTGAKGPNARVYNRIVWGVVSGRNDSIRTRLQQGIRDDLREELLAKLREAIE